MKNINIVTLGCSKNTYDSELLIGGLRKNKFNIPMFFFVQLKYKTSFLALVPYVSPIHDYMVMSCNGSRIR